MQIHFDAFTATRRMMRVTPFAAAVLLAVLTGWAQSPKMGVVRPNARLNFDQGETIKCLAEFLENGDPATGPSTLLLKAAPNCVVPPHYHTAEEQLMVVSGDVLTGMHDMKETVVSAGGFAMMPSMETHWFTCKSKEACLMFVTFDRTYDVVWVKQEKPEKEE
jgi:quercetin dioxygenase-like cupin family protein